MGFLFYFIFSVPQAKILFNYLNIGKRAHREILFTVDSI